MRRLHARICIALIAAVLSGCSLPSPAPAPVVMATQEGQVLRGAATAEIVGGSGEFSVSGSGLTCNGRFEPAIVSRMVAVTSSCSDGRVGEGSAERDGRLSGHGWIRMNDNTLATFLYGGDAAAVLKGNPEIEAGAAAPH